MKRIGISLLALMLVAMPAAALSTKDLLSLIAMPLAVAAVSDVNGVPQDQLANLVSTLNQANVPPDQFVEVIRYVPVALVDQNGQPFVAYVQEQTSQGVTGDALVNAIVQRLRNNYNVTPQLALNTEPTTFVVSDQYIPTTVVPQLGGSSDALSYIALPLAVAAVANLTGVPQDQLASLVATLNNANVPPAQEIEIVRYVPVALVSDNGSQFVQFVQTQVSQGVTGPALVPVVVQRLQPYYPPQTQIVVNAPAPTAQPVIVDEHFVPKVVTTRVEEVHAHPHGGPPGQIKKELGLQTGAEVVHGGKRGRQFTPVPVATVPAPSPAPVAVVPRHEEKEKEHGHGHGEGHGKRAQAPLPAPMISSAPAPAPAAAPPAVVVPQAVPQGNPGKGHEGGEKGGPPGQQKEGGKGKGHGKD